jgi:hypothetical protein
MVHIYYKDNERRLKTIKGGRRESCEAHRFFDIASSSAGAVSDKFSRVETYQIFYVLNAHIPHGTIKTR